MNIPALIAITALGTAGCVKQAGLTDEPPVAVPHRAHPTEASMQTITSTDGTRIAYFRSGRGRPLVLVHGTTSDHTRWAPVLPALEERFTVYAVDRRGRGSSTDADGPYDLEREFDDIAIVIDEVARSTGGLVDVLGHSYGGLCVLGAAQRTANIRKIVLYEPPVALGGTMSSAGAGAEMRQVEALEALLTRGDNEAVLVMFFEDVVHMPPSEVQKLRSLPNWRDRVAAAPTIPRELRAPDTYVMPIEAVAAINRPTLLLVGTESPDFLVRVTRQLHDVMTPSTIVSLLGQAHVAMNTAPELFAAEVLRFLDD